MSAREIFAMCDPKAAAKAAWPIFGGTSPGTTTTPPAGTDPGQQPTSQPPANPPAGGATPPAAPAANPLEALQSDPNALQQLLNQVTTMQTQLQTLQTENQGYKDAEAQAQREKQTKEQQLETDLANERAKTEKVMNLLQQKTLEQALANVEGLQWHSTADALHSLDQSGIKVTLDVDNGIANVEGVDTAAKDLAKKKPWLVKAEGTTDPGDGGKGGGQQQNGNTPPAGRPSGSPPPPPNNDAAKTKQRSAMIDKFPVIAHGNR